VAIHEAMEQQTISITKAGIKATLNARASILAAANPINGRYDKCKSLRYNINMSAPIMSRFDLFFILIDECNEVVDYWIAQRIVNFHTNEEESLQTARVYNISDIQKYITFARLCKPRISAEAQKLMIEEYKHLRQRESSNKSAWRITVRQLESMIRLSEALARMYLLEEVTEAHVKEAFRLLSKSIVRVEQPDIQLDENQSQFDLATPSNVPTTLGAEESTTTTTTNDGSDQEMQETNSNTKNNIKLSYDEYKRISNMLVYYIRKKEEDELTVEGDNEPMPNNGVHKSELIGWYLNEIEAQLENEQQLEEQSHLIEKIIHRLIHYDNVIISLNHLGLKERAGGEVATEAEKIQSDKDEVDPILVVHPNYIPTD
jgi:DNA replication licensing factor MCM6